MTLLASKPVFHRESAEILQRLRVSLGHLMNDVMGGVRKSNDAQLALGVDAKLSWQIHRLVNSTKPLELTQHIPVAASIRKLLANAAKRGARPEVVDAVKDAYSTFESHLQTHAGDRSCFDSMLVGLSDHEDAVQLDLTARRSLFEAHRHLWGLELDTFLASTIVYPSDFPDQIDVLDLRVKRGLRRFRAESPVNVDQIKLVKSDEKADYHVSPLDSLSANRYGASVLPEFCSTPLPEFTVCELPDGTLKTELAGDAIGRLGTVDLAFGTFARRQPLLARPGNRLGYNVGATFSTPATVAIIDLAVHRPTFGRLEHEVMLFGHASNFPPSGARPDLPMLAFRDPVTFLGSGSAAAMTPEIPAYVDMIKMACAKMDWKPDEFDFYRVRTKFPILETFLVAEFTIPKSENWSRPQVH